MSAGRERERGRIGSPEQRFMERMAFCGPGIPSTQELSMPRKARSLDLVMQFEEAPIWFGALREVCMNRVVLFEHVSRRARREDVASARVGEAWLGWERVRHRGRTNEPASRWGGHALVGRPPLAVVIADGVRGGLQGAIPLLRNEEVAGVWATPNLDEGGLIVLDTTRILADDGYAWWSWLGRAPTDAEAAERLFRLLGEPSIPTLERERLKEAIMEGELETSATERESVYQRLQREIRESREQGMSKGLQEGLEEGLQKGIAAGRRDVLLRLAATVAPVDLDELRSIDDLDRLEREITERIRRRS